MRQLLSRHLLKSDQGRIAIATLVCVTGTMGAVLASHIPTGNTTVGTASASPFTVASKAAFNAAPVAWQSSNQFISAKLSQAFARTQTTNTPSRVSPAIPAKLEIEVTPLVRAQTIHALQYDNAATGLSPFSSYQEKLQARTESTSDEIHKVVSLAEIRSFLEAEKSRYPAIDNKIFLRNARQKLPRYQKLFEQAAHKNQLDWRLVAAIAYQESVWNPDAVSPTGVRGMMMLTQITATEMGVQDRVDLTQSIMGGSAYFRKLLDRVSQDVTGPDRVLMALASYNMGYGHLLAARKITREQGGDHRKWKEVRKRLPLLQQSQYYSKSRYGYAHGALQALDYVERIRQHYDMLLMITEADAIAKGKNTAQTRTAFELARYR